mgnify:CR=1 FL=1
MYQFDKRIVMTLDAGGTNFVFSAIRSNEEIVEPIVLPSNGDNLEKCLETMVTGFSAIIEVAGRPRGDQFCISRAGRLRERDYR